MNRRISVVLALAVIFCVAAMSVCWAELNYTPRVEYQMKKGAPNDMFPAYLLLKVYVDNHGIEPVPMGDKVIQVYFHLGGAGMSMYDVSYTIYPDYINIPQIPAHSSYFIGGIAVPVNKNPPDSKHLFEGFTYLLDVNFNSNNHSQNIVFDMVPSIVIPGNDLDAINTKLTSLEKLINSIGAVANQVRSRQETLFARTLVYLDDILRYLKFRR